MVLDIVLRAGKIPFTLQPSEWDKLSFTDIPPELEEETKRSIEQMILVMEQQFRESHADRASSGRTS